MSGDDNLRGGGGDPDPDIPEFSLEEAESFVEDGSADWIALISYLATIAVLIAASGVERLVSGLLSLPQLAVAAVGDVYADLVEAVLGVWTGIFASSFETSADQLGDLGLFGFVVAVGLVIAWYVILAEVLEVL